LILFWGNTWSDKMSNEKRIGLLDLPERSVLVQGLDHWEMFGTGTFHPVEEPRRPGFARLLDRIEGNGVRVVLIEDASRFARDLIAQELGIVLLVARGVKVITAAGDDLTDTSDPSRVMMRQIAGAFAQYEKARLVARLRRAREVKGKMGGRKSHAELRPNVVALAKQLRKRQKSLREISRELAARGYLSKSGKPFTARSVSNMLEAS
jgi:DNA invertase Pin-like site-specific DNA recombinase